MKFYIFTLIYLISLLIAALYLEILPFWGGILVCWFSILFYTKYKKLDQNLTPDEKKLFYSIAYIYPLIETIIKFIIIKDVIPGSWNWLNRIEHFGFSAVLGFIFLPIIKPTLTKLTAIEAFIYFIGIVVILGNVNEFLEYLLRLQKGLTSDYQFSFYYWDSIYDLFINLLGTIFGYLSFRLFKNYKIRKNS